MSFKSQRVLLYITHRMRDSTVDMQTLLFHKILQSVLHQLHTVEKTNLE